MWRRTCQSVKICDGRGERCFYDWKLKRGSLIFNVKWNILCGSNFLKATIKAGMHKVSNIEIIQYQFKWFSQLVLHIMFRERYRKLSLMRSLTMIIFFRNKLWKAQLNERFDHEFYRLIPMNEPDSTHPTVNDELPNRIAAGMVVVKPNIKSFTEKGLSFFPFSCTLWYFCLIYVCYLTWRHDLYNKCCHYILRLL